jgi:uncharacterized protein (DUF2147 family)
MRFIAILAGLALAGAATPVAAGGVPQPATGLWLNPSSSVAVRTGPCGEKLCGWIVWANAQARGDARDGGVAQLLGTELLENYTPTSARLWSGTVFVPDMGRRFSSQIEQVSASQLKVKGCILGGLLCKSQVWTRIERLPNA